MRLFVCCHLFYTVWVGIIASMVPILVRFQVVGLKFERDMGADVEQASGVLGSV